MLHLVQGQAINTLTFCVGYYNSTVIEVPTVQNCQVISSNLRKTGFVK
jgi:hypothetical protein